MASAVADGGASDYETQGMALKLKELDEQLKQYAVQSYPCEARDTWCCGGSKDDDDDADTVYPFTIAYKARAMGMTHFDAAGACTKPATHRVVVLECVARLACRHDHGTTSQSRGEKVDGDRATGPADLMPAVRRNKTPIALDGPCRRCVQIAIAERIFREIITTEKADQLEQDFAKQQEADAKRSKK